MLGDLKGRRVLVTGASTGIGAAVAKALAAHGARVVVNYNSSKTEGEAVVAAITSAGGETHLVQADVSKSAEASRLVEETARLLGGLDVLINNAGAMIKRSPFGDIDDALYDKVLDTNVRSVIMTSKAALPFLRESRGGGAIISTSSVAARSGGTPGSTLYSGSKAFVTNITRTMARELAPHGIRVNAVAPGVIETPFHANADPEWLEGLRKSIPMGRLGTTDESVGVYLFLSSNAMSGYITGQTIELNGGQLMP